MIQRWDDLTPAEQQRYLTAEELRAQLAAVTGWPTRQTAEPEVVAVNSTAARFGSLEIKRD